MTAFDFLIIVLSALSIHRLWNYENFTKPLRMWVRSIPYLRKPAGCPACNAFWISGIAVLVWMYAPLWVTTALAGFMPGRVMAWVYARKAPAPPAPAQPIATTAASVVPAPVYERTVIIMTALADFRPSYSVASAVMDQAIAIAITQPSWEVQVWVMVGADSTGWDAPPSVKVRKIIPIMPWIENITSPEKSAELKAFLDRELAGFRGVTIITHDLLFVTWYTLFAHAIHLYGATGGHRWFHVPHSLPSGTAGKSPWITRLPAGDHRVVVVAKGFEQQFAEYYQIPRERVSRIPNIRDPRSWGTASPRVRHIVTQTKLWDNEFVQVFPVCSTRLEAKGFSKVVRTFALLNQGPPRAFLLICNPNAIGERSAGFIAAAKARAKELGLADDRWAFTSDLLPDSVGYGLNSDEMKFMLHGYANLLIFPSVSEADSLIIREAQLAQCFTIGNADVPTIGEGECDLAIRWGTTEGVVNEAVCQYVANRILDRGYTDKIRRTVLKTRNLEVIGHQWGALITAAGPLPV
jgi:hypothetical protein